MHRSPNNFLVIEPGLFLILALSVWIVSIKWLFAWIFAAIFHELCHIVALYFCKVSICSISFGIEGAKIRTVPMTAPTEIIAALAGPIGGLALLSFANLFPRISLCALVQSAYNLLPLFPLDGGRALRAGLSVVFSRNATNKAALYLQYFFSTILLISCVCLSVIWKLGLLPIGVCVIGLLRLFKANTSCKETNLIVQ